MCGGTKRDEFDGDSTFDRSMERCQSWSALPAFDMDAPFFAANVADEAKEVISEVVELSRK